MEKQPKPLDLTVGQVGYSLATYAEGIRGYFYFQGQRVQAKAGGPIRKWAEVLIITNVPERTVIEAWSVFPMSYRLPDGSFVTVSTDSPLPATMASKPVTHVTVICTAIGNTELVAAPVGATEKIRVHYFSVSNRHAVVVDVGLRFGAAGDIKHRHALAASGGNINANLTDAAWDGAAVTALNAYLDAAYGGGIIFNIGYTMESV